MALYGLAILDHTHMWYLVYTYMKQFRKPDIFYLRQDQYMQVVFNEIAFAFIAIISYDLLIVRSSTYLLNICYTQGTQRYSENMKMN